MVDKSTNRTEKSKALDRRKFLETASLSVTGLASIPFLGTASGARPAKDDVYDQSLKLRQKNDWDNNQWRKFLEKRGMSLGGQQKTVTVSPNARNNDEGVSTQKYDQYECTIYMTYTQPAYSSYDVIDLEWEHEPGFNDYGEQPWDYASIGYQSDYYSPTTSRNDWVYYSEDAESIQDENSETPNGAACQWGDVVANETGNFGVYLDKNWEEYDEWDRHLWFDYYHTWDNASFSGVSIGNDGLINIGFETTQNRWVIEDDHYEAQLYDGQSESG